MTDSLHARIEALPRGRLRRDHIQPHPDGEWVRYEDVLAALVEEKPPASTLSERTYQQPVKALVQQTAEAVRSSTLSERIAQWRGRTLTPTPAASDFERGYAEGRTFAFERCADEAELTLKDRV